MAIKNTGFEFIITEPLCFSLFIIIIIYLILFTNVLHTKIKPSSGSWSYFLRNLIPVYGLDTLNFVVSTPFSMVIPWTRPAIHLPPSLILNKRKRPIARSFSINTILFLCHKLKFANLLWNKHCSIHSYILLSLHLYIHLSSKSIFCS